jgi:starch-binding outer membrane protein, SusD/RagB family
MRFDKFKTSLVVGALCAMTLTSCEVTNPGPIQDQFLAEPASQQGLVNGAIRRMNELMYGNYTLALLAREVFPGGQIGAYGHDVIVQGGELIPGSFGGYFNDAVQARFISETAIKRFTEVGAPANMLYQAYLWGGWSYRYFGDWWCDAVVGSTDPDDETPGSFEEGTDTYYERAAANFTEALGLATTDAQRFAARAGRAQAYVGLGQWANASTDAAAVTDPEWTFEMNFSGIEQATFNTLYWANANEPYRSITMHHTFFFDYYDATGDPRVEYVTDGTIPFAVGSLSGYTETPTAQVPWSTFTKYQSADDNVNMASYWEMRLIMAEAILQQTPANYADAIGLINEVRTRPGVAQPALTPTNAEDAWTALKRERYLELFLEGRRATDERRWMTDGSGGTIDTPDWSPLAPIFVPIAERSLCFDIPTSERESNPNVPENP